MSRKIKSTKTVTLWGWTGFISLAPKNTVWFDVFKDTRKYPRQRADRIASITRSWVPEFKCYIWEVNLGRLQLILTRGIK